MNQVLITLLIICLIALAIILIFQILQIKQKNKPSKKFSTEFNQLALSIGLNKNQIKEIKDLLVRSGVKKPYLIFSDASLLENVITQNVQAVEKLNIPDEEKEKRILFLFEIKRKIHNHYQRMQEGISTTYMVDANQVLSMNVQGLGKFYSIVLVNDRKNLVCSIPDVENALKMDWKGKVADIYFWRYNDAGYIFRSRIANIVNNKRLKALLIEHSENLKRVQRREYPRRKARFNTKFFKFSISTSETGKPVALLGKTNFGVITDISPGGCSIISDDFLPANSALKMEFTIEQQSHVVYGTVINVAKRKGMYIMHIKFQRVTDKTKNTIYRYVYYTFK